MIVVVAVASLALGRVRWGVWVLLENGVQVQFSLDPAEPTNPDGPWYKAVYIPDFLNGSEAPS